MRIEASWKKAIFAQKVLWCATKILYSRPKNVPPKMVWCATKKTRGSAKNVPPKFCTVAPKCATKKGTMCHQKTRGSAKNVPPKKGIWVSFYNKKTTRPGW